VAPADLEARYAELEAAAEATRRARLRRQPLILIALTAALVIGTGLVASVDLRRLQTPQGVALRWTQAAVFGDCGDYLHYSTGPLDRPRSDVCSSLRVATEDARKHNAEIGLRVTSVTTRGASAVVVMRISRKDGTRTALLDLRRTGGRWRVVRDAGSCAAVGCA
jgi:hypothetical protein